MRSFYIMLLTAVLLAPGMYAQVQIEGGAVEGRWTYAYYTVLDDIYIEDSTQLIIDPGVTVAFANRSHLDVRGSLQALGTADSIITFAPPLFDSIEGWGGIRIKVLNTNNDSTLFKHCRFSYAKNHVPEGTRIGGALTIDSTDRVSVSKCIFQYNQTTGWRFSGGAGLIAAASSPNISGNLFINNEAKDGHGGAIFLTAGKAVLSNNVIAENEALGGGGITFVNSSAVLINNTIINNFAEHAGGVDIFQSSPSFINTIIYGNRTINEGPQVHLYQKFDANFINCAIEGGKGMFAVNHMQSGCAWCSGRYEGMIEQDSTLQYMSSSFRIAFTSPCVAAGKDSAHIRGTIYYAPPLDFHGTPRPRLEGPPDIGAVEVGDPVHTIQPAWETDARIISIYPNPAVKESIIEFELDNTSEVTIDIHAANGAHVASIVHGKYQEGRHTRTVDFTELLEGFYVITMRTRNSISVRPIVLAR